MKNMVFFPEGILLLFIPFFEYFFSTSQLNLAHPLFSKASHSIFSLSSHWKKSLLFVSLYALSLFFLVLILQYERNDRMAISEVFFCTEMPTERNQTIEPIEIGSFIGKIGNDALPIPSGFAFFSLQEKDKISLYPIISPTVHPFFLELVASEEIRGTRKEEDFPASYTPPLCIIFSTQPILKKRLKSMKRPYLFCHITTSFVDTNITVTSSSYPSLEAKSLSHAIRSLQALFMEESEGLLSKNNTLFSLRCISIVLSSLALIFFLFWMDDKKIGSISFSIFLIYTSFFSPEQAFSGDLEVLHQQFLQVEKIIQEDPKNQAAIESLHNLLLLPPLSNSTARQRALFSLSYAYFVADNFSLALQTIHEAVSLHLPLNEEELRYVAHLVYNISSLKHRLSIEDQKLFLSILENIVKTQNRSPSVQNSGIIKGILRSIQKEVYQQISFFKWQRNLSWPFFWISSEVEKLQDDGLSEEKRKALIDDFFLYHFDFIFPLLQEKREEKSFPSSISQRITTLYNLAQQRKSSLLDPYEIFFLTSLLTENQANEPVLQALLEALRLAREEELLRLSPLYSAEKRNMIQNFLLQIIDKSTNIPINFKNLLMDKKNWNSSLSLIQLAQLWKIASQSKIGDIDSLFQLIYEAYLFQDKVSYPASDLLQYIEIPLGRKDVQSYEELISLLFTTWISSTPIDAISWLIALQQEGKKSLFLQQQILSFIAEKKSLNEIISPLSAIGIYYNSIQERVLQSEKKTIEEAITYTHALQALIFTQFLTLSHEKNSLFLDSLHLLQESLRNSPQSIIECLQGDKEQKKSTIISIIKRMQQIIASLQEEYKQEGPALLAFTYFQDSLQELGALSKLIEEILISKKRDPLSFSSKGKNEKNSSSSLSLLDDPIRIYREMDAKDRSELNYKKL